MNQHSLMSLIILLKGCCAAQESDIREKLELCAAEYHCLSALEPGRNYTSSALSKTLGLSLSRTTRIVDKLIERGFINREAGPDRRSNAITLSPLGGKMHSQIESNLTQCETRLKNILTNDEYKAAQVSLSRLVQATGDSIKARAAI